MKFLEFESKNVEIYIISHFIAQGLRTVKIISKIELQYLSSIPVAFRNRMILGNMFTKSVNIKESVQT